MPSQPLDGLSVLELSTMVAGPYAGQMLGDMGADVVKIERPAGGELARGIEPDLGGESFYYLTPNRNKRSLALDVTSEQGRAAFLDLAERADVVLLNFPPAFADRYEIDYETVRERNEEIIYCSVSAFGHTGPYREYNGVDTTIQALSGAMSMTRSEESPPMRSGMPMNDVYASLYAVQGILLAVLNRRQTGEGDFVDVSLLDAALAGLTTRATYSLATGEPYPPFGRQHNYFAPEGVFEAADGEIHLSIITDRHWHRFCDVVGADELVDDPRFETLDDRIENHDACNDAVAAAVGSYSVDELLESLREAGVPAAPINDTVSVWDDPQVEAREMLQTMDHPDVGDVDTLGFPIKFRNAIQSIETHPPRLGEHSRAVLRAVGYDDEEIDQLVDAGVLRADE
ncbi:CaiB/BaiF CoA transferase family protein [Halovivax gelatinilyticus]|uniref:CaiB/BaiF CoA transferase family protein n=1 Tax=Halovivax gelatinilyticus TaxID=2961597 RepID=UPI0020CA5721|nr:CoA transferase [Halovivax gelatinilyticus]